MHVREAFMLLNKSIIRVEQPDINLDEEESHLQDMSQAANTDQVIVFNYFFFKCYDLSFYTIRI